MIDGPELAPALGGGGNGRIRWGDPPCPPDGPQSRRRERSVRVGLQAQGNERHGHHVGGEAELVEVHRVWGRESRIQATALILALEASGGAIAEPIVMGR